ncbi:hypothetical protein ACFVVX_36585 [Kitasatospora sp. NPDC058170]|uniref:hypothetical protein n=1 Tax=Kitasatospora sp. NPDC058170 TaxID=3346364 RepID=UPI0036D8505D
MSHRPYTAEEIWQAADLPARRLAGVALNPSAPTGVLLRLLACDSAAVRMTLCRDRDLPREVVDAVLTHPDARTRRFLAANPHVDPAQRARLVEDPHWLVRAWLGAGPGYGHGRSELPEHTVVRMLTTYDQEYLGTLYRQVPRSARWTFPSHPEPKVRAYAFTWWSELTAPEQSALLADPDKEVRERALRMGRDLDPAYVERELPDRPCHARTHLLMHGALSRRVVERVLAAPAGREDLAMIAGNPSLPLDVLALLTRDPDPQVRETAAGRPELTAQQRRELAEDPHPAVRTRISLHPALTEEERAAIDYRVDSDQTFGRSDTPASLYDAAKSRRRALSSHPVLRREAACDPALPPDLVARLSGDPDLGVRVLLAQNHPQAPADLLLRSFLEYTGRERWHLTTRPNFPRTELAGHAEAADPMVRRLTLLDPQAPPATVDRLSADSDPDVRADAARHPRLPPRRLTELLDDGELAHEAAANPALPPPVMHRLVAALDDRSRPASRTPSATGLDGPDAALGRPDGT